MDNIIISRNFCLIFALSATCCLCSCEVLDVASKKVRQGTHALKDAFQSKWEPQQRDERRYTRPSQKPQKRQKKTRSTVSSATPNSSEKPDETKEIVEEVVEPTAELSGTYAMTEAGADRLIVASMTAVLGSEDVKRVYFPHEGYECVLGGEGGERYVVTRVVVIGTDPDTGKSKVGYEFVVSREADEAGAIEDKTQALKKYLKREAAAQGSPMNAPR